MANDLVIGNTRFKKRDSHLATYCSSSHRTQIDYILFRKNFSKAVRDVKVIPLEECAQQHNLVVCDFTVGLPVVKKRKFTPRIRTWKLRDPTVQEEFQATFREKLAAHADTESDSPVEDMWIKLRSNLLEAATEVF